jgi:hypothetical protein
MSIRVNKKLGYGLLDLHTTDDLPDDPRWDYTKYKTDWRGVAEERDLKHFLAWCNDHKERLLELSAAEGLRDTSAHWLLTEAIKDRLKRKNASTWTAPYSAVEWDSEFGLANVVLFQCPQSEDWTRHDDILDYYEECDENGLRRRATLLPRSTGIHPHEGFMKRFRDPKPELHEKLAEATKLIQCFSFERDKDKNGVDITQLAGGHYNQLVGHWDSAKLPPLIKDPEVLKHFLEDWRPRVPLGVLAVIEYLGCFPDAFGAGGIVNSLRPMIYVVWR